MKKKQSRENILPLHQGAFEEADPTNPEQVYPLVNEFKTEKDHPQTITEKGQAFHEKGIIANTDTQEIPALRVDISTPPSEPLVSRLLGNLTKKERISMFFDNLFHPKPLVDRLQRLVDKREEKNQLNEMKTAQQQEIITQKETKRQVKREQRSARWRAKIDEKLAERDRKRQR